MKYVIWNPAGWLWENSFWCYFLTISVFLWSTCCFSLTQNKDAWEGFRVIEEYKREGRLLITKNNCWHWRRAFLNCFVNWKLQMFCREICKAHSTLPPRGWAVALQSWFQGFFSIWLYILAFHTWIWYLLLISFSHFPPIFCTQHTWIWVCIMHTRIPIKTKCHFFPQQHYSWPSASHYHTISHIVICCMCL